MKHRLRVAVWNLGIPIAEIVCAALILFHFSQIESKLRNDLSKDNDIYLRNLQSSMKCCGVTGKFDWNDWSRSHKGQLPLSCCPFSVYQKEKLCSVDLAYPSDCLSVFKEAYGNRYLTIGIVGVVVPLLEFFVMTFIYFMDKDTFSKFSIAVDNVG